MLQHTLKRRKKRDNARAKFGFNYFEQNKPEGEGIFV